MSRVSVVARLFGRILSQWQPVNHSSRVSSSVHTCIECTSNLLGEELVLHRIVLVDQGPKCV